MSCARDEETTPSPRAPSSPHPTVERVACAMSSPPSGTKRSRVSRESNGLEGLAVVQDADTRCLSHSLSDVAVAAASVKPSPERRPDHQLHQLAHQRVQPLDRWAHSRDNSLTVASESCTHGSDLLQPQVAAGVLPVNAAPTPFITTLSGEAGISLRHWGDLIREGSDPWGVPGSSWAAVIGCCAAKAALQEALLLPLLLPPGLLVGIRRAPCALLLHGPPGTGKTQLVRAAADASGRVLICGSAGTLISKWAGESEGALRSLFQAAAAAQPSILFLDELDALSGPARGDATGDAATRRLLVELLLMLGDAPTAAPRMLVCAATNRVGDLDPALLRRFDKRVAVPLPGAPERLAMLTSWLEGIEVDFQIDGADRDINGAVECCAPADDSSGSPSTGTAASHPLQSAVQHHLSEPPIQLALHSTGCGRRVECECCCSACFDHRELYPRAHVDVAVRPSPYAGDRNISPSFTCSQVACCGVYNEPHHEADSDIDGSFSRSAEGVSWLLSETSGWSGADLRLLATDAAMAPVWEALPRLVSASVAAPLLEPSAGKHDHFERAVTTESVRSPGSSATQQQLLHEGLLLRAVSRADFFAALQRVRPASAISRGGCNSAQCT